MAPITLRHVWLALATPALLLSPTQAQDSATLSCDFGDDDSACMLLLQHLNDDLTQESISISKDSIMYSYSNSNAERIDTGHSCSSTAQVRGRTATATIGTDIDLDLSGDAISDPFMLKLEVPVDISASVRVKQRFGVRILGSCSNTGSDSYTFRGGASTRAKVAVAVDFNPSFGKTSAGNFEVSIDPIVAVALDVDDVDLNLSVSGVSPLNAVATFIHGFSSTLFRATTALFRGESVSDVFEETVAFDIGVPLGLGLLAGPAKDLVLDFIEKKGEREIKQRADGFALELQNDLSAKVRKALGVEGKGKRSFLISKDYKKILVSGGSLEDILVEPVSTDLCTWTYSYSGSRGGGGGLYGPVARGVRCTADKVGDKMRSGRSTYTCIKSSFNENQTPPSSFGPC